MRHNNSVVVILMSVFIGSAVWAAPKKVNPKRVPSNQGGITCQTVPWLAKRDLSLRELTVKFDALNRAVLIQMAWNELLKPHSNSILMPLLHYLSMNSRLETERTYFAMIGYYVANEVLPEEAVSKWPQRVPVGNWPFGLPKLCELHTQAVQAKTN